MKKQGIARTLQVETTVSNLVTATHTLSAKYLEHSSQLRELYDIVSQAVSKTELHAAIGGLAYKNISGNVSQTLQQLIHEKYNAEVTPIPVPSKQQSNQANEPREEEAPPVKRPNENWARYDRKLKLLEEMIIQDRQQSNATIEKLTKDIEHLQSTVQELTSALREASQQRTVSIPPSPATPAPSELEQDEEIIVIPPVRRARRSLLKQKSEPPPQDISGMSTVSQAMRYMRQPSLPTSTKETEAVKEAQYQNDTSLQEIPAETIEPARNTEPVIEQKQDVVHTSASEVASHHADTNENETEAATDPIVQQSPETHTEQLPGAAPSQPLTSSSVADDDPTLPEMNDSIATEENHSAVDALQVDSDNKSIESGDAQDHIDAPPGDLVENNVTQEASEVNNEFAAADVTDASVQVNLQAKKYDAQTNQSIPVLHAANHLSRADIQHMIDTRVAMHLYDIKMQFQNVHKNMAAQGAIVDHFQSRINSSLSMASDAASKYTWLSDSLSILNNDYNVLYKNVTELHAQAQSTEYSMYSMINNVISVVDNIVLKLDKQRDVQDAPLTADVGDDLRFTVIELQEKVDGISSMLQKTQFSPVVIPSMPSINTTGATVQESNYHEEIKTLLREMRKHESDMRHHASDYQHVVAEHRRLLDELSKRPSSSPVTAFPTPVTHVSVTHRPVTSHLPERSSPVQTATQPATPSNAWKLDSSASDIATLRRDMDNLKQLMLKNMLAGKIPQNQSSPAKVATKPRSDVAIASQIDKTERKKHPRAVQALTHIDAGVMFSVHPTIPLQTKSASHRLVNQADDAVPTASVSSSVPALSVNNIPAPQPPATPKRTAEYHPHYLSLNAPSQQTRISNLDKLLGDGNFEMPSIGPPIKNRRSNTASANTRRKYHEPTSPRAQTVSGSFSEAEDAFITSVYGQPDQERVEKTEKRDDNWFREIGHTIPSEPYSVLMGGSSTAWHNPFSEAESSFVSDLS